MKRHACSSYKLYLFIGYDEVKFYLHFKVVGTIKNGLCFAKNKNKIIHNICRYRHKMLSFRMSVGLHFEFQIL